jgi:hypothetical protein
MAALVALVVPLVVIAVAQDAPAIKFLNPSSYKPCPDANAPCFVISDTQTSSTGEENNGENETEYRLNAWSDNTPVNALVEFEIDVPQDLGLPTTQVIGTATRVENDTWEFSWDVDLPDGQYELRTILYEGVPGAAEEVARDEKLVYLLTGAGTEQGTAEPAADIVFPANGAATGFYVNPISGATNTLVDVEWSAGTTHVQVNYTLSDPGDDPVWKQCALARVGSSNSQPAGQGRIRCVLANVDQGGQSVTAINAVANESPGPPAPAPTRYDPNLNQAGDAIRVLPYKQDGVSMVIDNVSVRADSNPEGGFKDVCSEGQIIRVLDQNGNPIGDMNVDVHAHGPSDQLKFQGSGFGDSPPNEPSPPDNGHGGTEPNYVCNDPFGGPSGQNFAGEQGEHNRPGAPDLKHGEGNTGNTGSFGIGMHSDRAGETFITFWADEDNDDLFCSQEPSIAATIGWDQPAPTAGAETPVKTDCPIPNPPPPTGTASPTPTDSPTEDPRGCTVSGDEGDNELEGTEGNDVICGNGGDDTIRGLGGDDILYGDAGNDIVSAGDGEDTINGGDDDDRLFGESSNDLVNGGAGGDQLVGGSGNDTLVGVGEPDVIRGGGGRDIIQGGRANDFGYGGSGDDVLKGFTGNDILRGGNAADVIRAGKGTDTLFGERGPDALTGGPGRDRCRGGAGRDRQRSCER